MTNQPKLRTDLIPYEHNNQSRNDVIVLKDVVSGRYYRLSSYEYRLLEALDGARTIEQAVEKLKAEGFYYSQQDATIIIGRAAQLGLLLGTKYSSAEYQLQLKELSYKQRKAKRLSSVYFLFIPLFNPDRFLDKTMWLGRLFANTLTGLIIALAAPGALYLIIAGLDRIQLEYLFFFNWQNLTYLWITIALTKLVHELAHAYVAKSHGLYVPEMGIAFLLFFPCLFCNTTDAWQLADRKQRAAIAAAGIIAELAIAVPATYVWYFSKPGLVNSLAFYLMAVSLISTFLFNGNPLLKFDGYFILVDYLNMPNLAGNSSKYVKHLFLNRVMGNELVANPAHSSKDACIFTVYGVSVFLYRIVLYVGIVVGVYYRFDKLLGIALGCLAMVLFIVRPIWVGMKSMYRNRRNMKPRLKGSLIFLSCLALIGVVLCIPWSSKSVYPCFVGAGKTQKLSVPLHSLVTKVHIRDGDLVQKGELLFQLDSSQLELMIREKKTEREIAGKEIKLLLLDDETIAEADAKEIELKQIEDEMDFLNKQLQLARNNKAPFDGVVTKLDPRLQPGFQPGKGVVVGELFSTKDRIAHALVPANDIDKIHTDSEIKIWLPVGKGLILNRKIASVKTYSEKDLRDSPFSSRFGGELATEIRDDNQKDAPLEAQYDCSVVLNNEGDLFPFGITGRLAVSTPPRSIVARAYHRILRTFNRESLL